MPIIPRYDSQVQQAPLPGVRAPTDAPIEAFGGSSQRTTPGEAMAQTLDKGSQIAMKAKAEADDVATQAAYTSALQEKNEALYNPQTGAYTKKGKDALGVSDQYGQSFNKSLDGIEAGLSNPVQRQMFQRMRSSLNGELNTELERHTFIESQKYDADVMKSGVNASIDNAVKNYHTPGAVDTSMGNIETFIKSYAQRNNMPQDEMNQQIAEAKSKAHTSIIASMLANGQEPVAKQYYENNKDSVMGADRLAIDSKIHDADVLSKGIQTYDQVKGMLRSDGTPNESAMRAAVFSAPGMSDQDKFRNWEFVKARAGEDLHNRMWAQHASDQEFQNQAIKARQDNVPLATAMNLVNQYSRDESDKQFKTGVLQTIYGPPQESDPTVHIDLWEKIQSGKASKADIENAFNNHQLSQSDAFTLKKDLFNVANGGSDPELKLGWNRIKTKADATFSDKNEKAQFLYVVKKLGEGKSPEELEKIADDQLKETPKEGFTGLWGLLKNPAPWKANIQKMDASNLAWGKVYQDVGQDEATAIGAGALRNGRPTWGLGDLDSFAQQFGGYDAIKKGTPVNNAIQSLVKHKKYATPANVKAVLDMYKDGVY